MSDTVIPFIPAGKIRCYITKKLRKDTPEENIRQRWARSLVEEYRYNIEDIGVETKIKMGSSSKRADLVVWKEGAPKKPENILLIVEAKRADVLPRSKDEGLAQLKSYMSATNARFGLWVGSERVVLEKAPDGGFAEIVDLPSRGELEPRVPTYSDLIPAADLKALLKRCHNYIYANQGLQKAEAFHEVLKLIFCKVYDEIESAGPLRFFVRTEERRSEAGQFRLLDDRIAPLFEAVKERYPYIFKPSESIDLNRKTLAYVVSEFQKYSLLLTRADVKGSAYEELVGANLRGDRGEYFTPRNVCDMAVQMVMATYSVDRLSRLKILDTCSGTGGFLVAVVNFFRRLLEEQERAKGGSNEDIRARVTARIKDLATLNIFGLDINPFLVRTSQMNLVMHGDGSANVFQADSLYSPSEWADKEAARRVRHAQFDVVVTNPPFGGNAQVDDPHLLDQYELASYGAKDTRSVMPAEQLFVEATWRFLKPGGRLAIVLPDSILNNPGLQFIRQWLMQRSRVIATVDLPKETFAEGGGVPNPSVLIVERLTREEIRLAEAGALDEYDVFMSIPKTAGRDKRGNPVYFKTPEGFEVLGEDLMPIEDDEISLVAAHFEQWFTA